MADKGTLYVVATPIGNLEDITYRAARVLGSVDLIACEDTRKSRILLQRLKLPTPTMSLHKFSEREKTHTILDRLEKGQHVALISEAGTPAVSDPGSRLVRAALEEGYRVVPIPGPSSITAALSVSGVDCSSFVYFGFAPKKARQLRDFFGGIISEERTCVFFESPQRIRATLKSAAEILGSRKMAVMRELTKLHEEIIRGTPEAILAELETRPSVKGEIVVVIEPGVSAPAFVDLAEAVKTLLAEGYSGKRLADEAHQRFGVKKSTAYNKFLEMKDTG